MNSQEFALSVAALRRDGEEDDGQPYEMSIDVAFDTLARIIREAREIVKTAAEKLEPPIDTSKSAVANIAAVLEHSGGPEPGWSCGSTLGWGQTSTEVSGNGDRKPQLQYR